MQRRRLIQLRHARPLQLCADGSLVGVNRGAPFRRVLLVDQLRDGNIRKVRIAEEYRAVKERTAIRLGHQMQMQGGVALGRVQVETFKNVERLNQRDAAGGGRRRTVNVISAIGSMYGRALDDLVIGKIGGGNETSALGDCRGDLVGQRAAIKLVRIARDALQGTCQLRLLQDFARLIKSAIALEDPLGLGITRQLGVVHHRRLHSA